jgi:hypothetical protein
MTRDRRAELAERRAQLVTRAHVDRARMTLAMLEVRMMVSPPPDRARSAELRPMAATILTFAVPLLGATRVGRLLRIASFALAALRIARSWKGRTA